jgi:branched-chain amino acid transport system permease protein
VAQSRFPWISLGIALAIAVFFPLLSGMSYHILNVAIIMLIFILFSSAWNFLAYSGQASLGHAAFFGIGGYVSTLIARSAGYTSFATILAGGCVAAFIGFLLGLTCVRLKEWFLAMVTFGFAVILQVVVAISMDNYLVIEYYVILAVTVVSIVAIYLVLRSRAGLAFAAIRENETEAQAAGINPVTWKLLAFTFSSFLTGISGALMVHHIGFISPEIFSPENSFWPIIYSIFGGLGTISGPIIGTIVLTIVWDGLKELGLTYERFIIIGLLLIVVVIFLPRGLVSLPGKVRERCSRQKKG